MRHYEPLSTAFLEFDGVKEVRGYKRWLDIEKSVSGVIYKINGVKVTREIFASFPDQVLVMRVTASEPVKFGVRLNRLSNIEYETNEYVDSIRAENVGPNTARITLHATPGGKNSNSLVNV